MNQVTQIFLEGESPDFKEYLITCNCIWNILIILYLDTAKVFYDEISRGASS